LTEIVEKNLGREATKGRKKATRAIKKRDDHPNSFLGGKGACNLRDWDLSRGRQNWGLKSRKKIRNARGGQEKIHAKKHHGKKLKRKR